MADASIISLNAPLKIANEETYFVCCINIDTKANEVFNHISGISISSAVEDRLAISLWTVIAPLTLS